MVLDSVHNILLTPVDAVWEVHLRDWSGGGGLTRLGLGAVAEKALVFCRGVASELVEGNGEAAVGTVVGLDEAGIGEEDAKAEVVLVTRVEGVGRSHPFDKGLLLVWHSQDARRKAEKRKHCLMWKLCRWRFDIEIN